MLPLLISGYLSARGDSLTASKYFSKGEKLLQAFDWARAVVALERSVELTREEKKIVSKKGRQRLRVLSMALHRAGNAQRALEVGEEALAVCVNLNSEKRHVIQLHTTGYILCEQEQHLRAIELLVKCLSIRGRSDRESNEYAAAKRDLGYSLYMVGRTSEGLIHLEGAVTLFEQNAATMTPECGYLFFLMAKVKNMAGDKTDALNFAKKARDVLYATKANILGHLYWREAASLAKKLGDSSSTLLDEKDPVRMVNDPRHEHPLHLLPDSPYVRCSGCNKFLQGDAFHCIECDSFDLDPACVAAVNVPTIRDACHQHDLVFEQDLRGYSCDVCYSSVTGGYCCTRTCQFSGCFSVHPSCLKCPPTLLLPPSASKPEPLEPTPAMHQSKGAQSSIENNNNNVSSVQDRVETEVRNTRTKPVALSHVSEELSQGQSMTLSFEETVSPGSQLQPLVSDERWSKVPRMICGEHFKLSNTQLGAGAFCSVFLGEQLSATAHKQVAIKVFNGRSLSKLEREARIYQLPNKVNVVNVIGVSEEGSTSYLIMEYLRLGSLRHVMRTYGNVMTPSFVVKAAWEIAKGMHSLQDSFRAPEDLIFHGDLKSDNVLVDGDSMTSSDLWTIKIADFGEAHGATEVGRQKGTVPYMAPEILSQNFEKMSKYNWISADLWSFGVICWELLDSLVYGEYHDPMIAYKAMGMETRLSLQEGLLAGRRLPFRQNGLQWESEMSNLIKSCWTYTCDSRPNWDEIIPRLEAICGTLQRELNPRSK